MQQGNPIIKYWLEIVCGFVVIVATARILVELPLLTETRYWVLVIFSILVWFSGAYEITIKRCMKEGVPKKIILFKCIIVWIIPYFVGCGVSVMIKT